MNGAPSLLDLVPLSIEQLTSNLELTGTIVRIHESYFLLDAPRILQVSFARAFVSTSYSNKTFQLGAVDLFRAFNSGISEAIAINVKQMTTALCMLLQIAPAGLWGEALHVSGLFATIVTGLEEDKACVPSIDFSLLP